SAAGPHDERAAERSHPRELVDVVEAGVERFGAPHRETRDRAILAVDADVVRLLDRGHDLAQEDLRIPRDDRAELAGGAVTDAVAERRDDDHRHRLPLR